MTVDTQALRDLADALNLVGDRRALVLAAADDIDAQAKNLEMQRLGIDSMRATIIALKNDRERNLALYKQRGKDAADAEDEVARLRELVSSDVDFERIRADGYQREVARLRAALTAIVNDDSCLGYGPGGSWCGDDPTGDQCRYCIARAALGEGTGFRHRGSDLHAEYDDGGAA